MRRLSGEVRLSGLGTTGSDGGGRVREGTRERLIGSGGAEEMGEVAETDNERWKFYSSGKTKGGHVVEVSGGRGAELEAPGPHKGRFTQEPRAGKQSESS